MAEGDSNEGWKVSYWTIFFSVLSLALFELAFFIPGQRLIISLFLLSTVIIAVILFYFNRINYVEKMIKNIGVEVDKLSGDMTEKFNYIKELYNLKVDVEMLKKRKGEIRIRFIDIVAALLAVIIIYAIYLIIRENFFELVRVLLL